MLNCDGDPSLHPRQRVEIPLRQDQRRDFDSGIEVDARAKIDERAAKAVIVGRQGDGDVEVRFLVPLASRPGSEQGHSVNAIAVPGSDLVNEALQGGPFRRAEPDGRPPTCGVLGP